MRTWTQKGCQTSSLLLEDCVAVMRKFVLLWTEKETKNSLHIHNTLSLLAFCHFLRCLGYRFLKQLSCNSHTRRSICILSTEIQLQYLKPLSHYVWETKKKALFLFFAKCEYILSSNPQSAIPPKIPSIPVIVPCCVQLIKKRLICCSLLKKITVLTKLSFMTLLLSSSSHTKSNWQKKFLLLKYLS